MKTEILIDIKKYILFPEKKYQLLKKHAALNSNMDKVFSVEEARKYSKGLIKKWAKEKNNN